MVCIVTNVTMTMKNEMSDVRVCVKNLSVGMVNNTYDIYTQLVPTLASSESLTCPEIFVPYGKMKVIGTLANVDDIKTRGSSLVSSWAYNKNFLRKIYQEIKDSNFKLSEKDLQLVVTAGVAGFYISYYNWVPRASLRDSAYHY